MGSYLGRLGKLGKELGVAGVDFGRYMDLASVGRSKAYKASIK